MCKTNITQYYDYDKDSYVTMMHLWKDADAMMIQ